MRPTVSSTWRRKRLIRIHHPSRRHRDLDVPDRIAQRRFAREQALDRQKPAGNPLRVVEPVDAEQDAASARAFADGRGLRNDRWIPGERIEGRRVDAHGKHPELHAAFADVNAIDLRFDAVHVQERCHEMPQVGERVKADQIRPEQPAQNLAPPRQDPEHLRRRERDVEKEPDAGVRQVPTDHRRHEHQLVIMNPDRIAGPVTLDDRVREFFVHLAVGVPSARLDRHAVGQVMEKGPQHPVGEALVIPLDFIGRQIDRRHPPGLQLAVHVPPLLRGEPADVARPANPETLGLRVPAVQPGRKPATRALETHRSILEPCRDRQAIRDNQQPARGCGTAGSLVHQILRRRRRIGDTLPPDERDVSTDARTAPVAPAILPAHATA